ncbi:hypothetical protein ACFQO9_16555 [Chryseobacterium zhengzhouense]|uniref:Uncharacterized protein n=1 Tax=Chryseobacterium zhengzhouense TaxID=1636086 RepID=A0ABW2M4F9_9FLAO
MPVYTRIIISAEDFLSYSKDLLNQYNIHCYVEYRDKKKKASYKKVDLSQSFSHIFSEKYDCFFLCAKEPEDTSVTSFYDDEWCDDTIVAEGGRETETEIEQLDLRIISKLHNDNIRLFVNALNAKMKKDPQFGKGIEPENYLNKNIFYKKGLQKIIWASFERKLFLDPIELPAE